MAVCSSAQSDISMILSGLHCEFVNNVVIEGCMNGWWSVWCRIFGEILPVRPPSPFQKFKFFRYFRP